MLDRTRPHGEVFGASTHRFEQDGMCFDVLGRPIPEITEPLPPIDPADPSDAQPVRETVIGEEDGVIDALQMAENVIDQAQAAVAKKRKR